MYVIDARNVNTAYQHLSVLLHRPRLWVNISPRGAPTLEFVEPVATTYYEPRERVLFNVERDANPFFHLMEAVWIAAGRRDVWFLSQFLPPIEQFSDDGKVFNAAYGYRLREHFGMDQIAEVVDALRRDATTRRAFWVIGDPRDINRETRDVACNVAVFFKLRQGRLNITVCNRSNDAVWGAYGANVVQFSFLQELVAAAVGAEVGCYTQVSDSFHVYADNPKVQQLMTSKVVVGDPYAAGRVVTYPVCTGGVLEEWLDEAAWWVDNFPHLPEPIDPFFRDVLNPMAAAFLAHRVEGDTRWALKVLEDSPAYAARVDWLVAGHQWLSRRSKGAE